MIRTNILGSQVKGEKVVADIGGNLNIVSQQDTDNYTEKNKSGGFGFSIGQVDGKPLAPGVAGPINKVTSVGTTGSFNTSKTDSTYESVTDQAGIYAGKDGFDIHVGKNTDLKGAVISSEATPDKNKISTDTLTWMDLHNKAKYSASSTGIGYSSDKGFTPTPGIPVSGDADSTTKSAVAPGDILIRSNPNMDISDLSRDTENASQALAKIFDKKTVEERQELAKVFGEVAYKLIGNIALHYQKKKFDSDVEAARLEIEANKAEAEGNSEQANSLREQATRVKARAEELAKWNDGGSAKIILHALAGGVMAAIGNGSFGAGALSAGINESLQNEINKLPSEWRSLGSAVIGATVSEIVGGNGQSGAAITTSAAENNFGLHKLLDELKNIVFGTAVDATISWMTGEDFDLLESILENSSYNDLVQVYAKFESGDYLGAIEHAIALGASVGVGKNVEKLNQLSEKVKKYKGLSKAAPEKVINALSDYQSRYLNFGNQEILIDKAGMKHILERHHPDYWDGSVKSSQSFLDKNMSIDDVANVAEQVLQQNRDTIVNKGTNGMYQIEGIVNGVEYVLGVNNGRVGQLYPK